MKALVPKVLVKTCGRAMVEHVLDAVRPVGAHATVVVFGHGGDQVRLALSDRDVKFAHQPEQRGTGHAVQCAMPALEGFDGDVLVLCGDTPLLTGEVLLELVADHRKNERALTVLSAVLRDPGSLGRILRGADGKLSTIREKADATQDELAICEINTGVMIMDAPKLRRALAQLKPDNAQGEYYLTDVPRLLLAEGHAVDAYPTTDEGSALGVNNPVELAEATSILRRRYADRFLTDGVILEDRATTAIDAGVELGPRARIRAFTRIGAGARVGGHADLGPFVEVGDGVVLGERVVVGAHSSVESSALQDDVVVAGAARLRNCVVGQGARIGAGVVTSASGDGRVVIGDGATVGAGSILVAPVTVAEGATVEPGTVLGPNR